MNKTPHVFISATREDLEEYCAAAIEVCNQLKLVPIDMHTNFPAMSAGATEGSLSQIQQTDIFIGIYAHRYGYIEPGYDKSVTECEYDFAKENEKECLCFMHDPKCPWPPMFIDYNHHDKIEAFHNKIEIKHIRGTFKSVEDFKIKLHESLRECKTIKDWNKRTNTSHTGQENNFELERNWKKLTIGLPFLDVYSFYNRQPEMEQLRLYLSDPSVRLVSVIGPSGVGKTALVSKICNGISPKQSRTNSTDESLKVDGLIYFVCKSDDMFLTERLLEDILHFLKYSDAKEVIRRRNTSKSSNTEVFRYLLSQLEGKIFLIVMDNFEELLGSDGHIRDENLADLVDLCLKLPQPLKFLVTSREGIEFDVETIRAVRTLPLNKGLPQNDAIEMLQAMDPQGDLGLKDLARELLIKAVERCEGIPGALERIAGLLHDSPTLTLSTLLENLNIDALTEKQYQAQTDDRKSILNVLAVYNLAVPDSAIKHILNIFQPSIELGTNLRALVRNFMVIASRQNGTYQLPPSIQSYVFRKLMEEGDDFPMHDYQSLAADYFITQRKAINDCQNLNDLQPYLEEIKHRNQAKEFNQSAIVANLIQDRLDVLGYFRTIRDIRESLRGGLSEPTLIASNEGFLGEAVRRLGNLHEAKVHFQLAIKNAQKANDTFAQSKWYGELGNTYADMLEMNKAIETYQLAIEIAQNHSHRAVETRNLGYLAIVYRQTAQFNRAIECYKNALEIYTKFEDQFDNQRIKGQLLGNMGKSYMALGEFDRAMDCVQQAVQIMKKEKWEYAEGVYENLVGVILLYKRQFSEAVTHLEHSHDLLDKLDEKRNHSYIHESLGRAYHHMRKLEKAQSSYEEGISINVPETMYLFLGLLGLVFLEKEDYMNSEKFLLAAIEHSDQLLHENPSFYEASFFRGFLSLAMKQDSEALVYYQKALNITKAYGVIFEAILYIELLENALPDYSSASKMKKMLLESVER